MSKNIILATIYKLVFKHNTNIAYVGQSTNINSRFKQHIKNAKDFSNIDNKLYFFMNLYGIHNFFIETFYNISYIDLHHCSFIFYNLVIWVMLNHYFMLRNLNLISKIKIIQIYISIKIIFRCLTLNFLANNITFYIELGYFLFYIFIYIKLILSSS